MGRRLTVGDEVRVQAGERVGSITADNGHAYKVSGTWYHQDEVDPVLRVLNELFSVASYDGGEEDDEHNIREILKPALNPFHCSGPGVGHTVEFSVDASAAPGGVLLTHVVVHGAPGCSEPLRSGRIWAAESPGALGASAEPLACFETDPATKEWSGALGAPRLARVVRIAFDTTHGEGENVDVAAVVFIGVRLDDPVPLPATCAAGVPAKLGVTGLKRVKRRKHWLPLESNPKVVSTYLGKLGVGAGVSVHELLSLEDWALEMVPRPARAVLLLFPISEQTEASRKAALASGHSGSLPCEGIVHMRQLVGNACGTIALVHTMANLCRHGGEAVESGSWLEKFLAAYSPGMSSDDLGKLLEEDVAIEKAHAEAEKASEARHDRAANRNLHFIAFVDIHGQVVELDGRNDVPIGRGDVSEWGGDFLLAACAMIRAHYMDVSPDALRFNMMAVCTAGPQSGAGAPIGSLQGSGGAGPPAASEEALGQLAAFGFGREEAAAALEAAGGNVEAAANLLLG